MHFLDEAVITVRSGDGGKGCVSFRREKYVPRGGPDGGDGGNGGSLVARATKRLYTLTDYSSRRFLKAGNGEAGRGKNQTGKNAADLVLEVPLGTVVQELDTGEILADMIYDNQEVRLRWNRGKGEPAFRYFDQQGTKVCSTRSVRARNKAEVLSQVSGRYRVDWITQCRQINSPFPP